MGFFSGISVLRAILDTETDSDSPGSEELLSQIRENLESYLMLNYDTGDSGSATEDPPDDATGVLTDSGASYAVDGHNGRTLLITSGNAKGNLYTIDDITATTIVCTGDNLYSDGVRDEDTYKIFYDVKVNADGHDHDGINSKSAVLSKGRSHIFSGTAHWDTNAAVSTWTPLTQIPVYIPSDPQTLYFTWYGQSINCSTSIRIVMSALTSTSATINGTARLSRRGRLIAHH